MDTTRRHAPTKGRRGGERKAGGRLRAAAWVLAVAGTVGCGAGPGPGPEGTKTVESTAAGPHTRPLGRQAEPSAIGAALWVEPRAGSGAPDADGSVLRAEEGAGAGGGARAPAHWGAPEVPGEFLRVELDVRFDAASDEIRPLYRRAVADLAGLLTEYPELTAVIEGHADSTGSPARNRALSRRRAEAVVRLLTERHGIDSSRLTTVGRGAARPIAPNDTAEGRAHNRRVTAVLAGR